MSSINLLHLPLDVLIQIFKKLNVIDLRNLILTCKSLKEIIVFNNTVWRYVTRDMLIIHKRSQNRLSTPISEYNLARISQNWRNGRFKHNILLKHSVKYMPWLIFHDCTTLILSTGSMLRSYGINRNGTLKNKYESWKIYVPKIKRNDVRTNDISRFIIKDNLIVCGNRDGCVAIYETENFKRRPQLVAHIKDCHKMGQAEVTAVEVIKTKDVQYILTCSSNSSDIKYWCWKHNDNEVPDSMASDPVIYRKSTDLPDNSGLRCLAMNSCMDRLAIGLDGNSKPLLLDITTEKLLYEIKSTVNMRQAVRDVKWLNDNTLSFVTHSGFLRSIDVRTGEEIYNASDPFQSTFYCMQTDGEHAVVAGSCENSRSVLYDTRSDAKHVQIFFTSNGLQSSPVYSLDFDSHRLITATDRLVTALHFDQPLTTIRKDYSQVFEHVQ